MTSCLSRSPSVLCVLACLFTALPLRAAEDGARKPDVGVVHAAGDEAWIDIPANLGDTWKATLAELKERGHLTDADVSYVESNGQIALASLWIAVLPGASLDVPITRVRIVVLVSAEDHEQHTAALVGAGALLGAIAERLPAASATPSPFSVDQPAPAAPEYAEDAEASAVSDELVTTYNTYNTYNTYSTYDTYDTYDPVYVGYAPSVVYVWKPWWWLGWCHNGWSFGWNTWGLSYWNSCSNFGWGWNAGWSPWWNWPCNTSWSPNWNCNPSWSDCNDNNTFVATPAPVDPRLQTSFVDAPNLSFARRETLAGSPASSGSSRLAASDVASGPDRGTDLATSSRDSSPGWRISRTSSSDALASVDAFPPRISPSDLSDRGASGSHSRSSQAPRSIVVTERSSSGTRAKPGSVTKLKGLTLTTKLGAINDAGSVARSAAVPKHTSASPGFSASSTSKPSSPFTIGGGNNSGGRGASGTSVSSSSSSSSSSRGPDPSPGHSSTSHSSQTFTIGSSHQNRQAAPAPTPQPAPRVSAPAPRSSGGSHSASVGRSSGGGGSSASPGGGSSGSRGASSTGSSGGGGGGSSHGSGGRSSGRGPR